MAYRSLLIFLLICIIFSNEVFCYATFKLRPRNQRFAAFNHLLNTIPVMPKLTFYPQAPIGRAN
ncbi:Neuropeptide-Like Protein [Caenorhabditis elegans]|uniref:Neuropeptide-Like Protein n=1 Tax=Caenorhabditis elegans TaxID=6239 RepID=H2L273_CAEEL|nr:Neuropeptide-Like Protein [Caenorhabditis elegans]CCE71329.1 Neuropeptide-Like Protein [Caenorhabditis elegans]|eukprot:NP_001254315.1 Uncharacterized protein CELE_F43G6.16 [Caenorhabditis elegans]